MTVPEIYSDDVDEPPEQPEVSKRSRGVALLLALFGGIFGLHRFYVDKPRTAIAMIFTGGGCFFWWLYDLVLITAGEFRDSGDLPLKQWEVSEVVMRRQLLGRAEQRVSELEEQFDALRRQFNELAERVDFAERMLAQHREAPRLPPRAGS